MPSFQWAINVAFPPDSLKIVSINNTSSRSWLRNYRMQTAISYPFVFDSTSELFTKYKVGSGYGNLPPTYILIDMSGIVRYRVDDQFNKTSEIAAKIRDLLAAGP